MNINLFIFSLVFIVGGFVLIVPLGQILTSLMWSGSLGFASLFSFMPFIFGIALMVISLKTNG